MSFGNHNVSAMTRRILTRHDSATGEQREEGTAWYRNARTFAAVLSEQLPYSFEQIAHVIAALSPQVTWEKNIESTHLVIAAHLTGQTSGKVAGYPGYTASTDKAFRILAGDLSALKGPKVEAFAAAITGDLSHVVCDIWACRAARSSADNLLFMYTDGELPGARERRAITEAYRRAAARRDVEPAVMQAIVWTVTRGCETWTRPQHMSEQQRTRLWRRQAAARARAGLGKPYDWNAGAKTKYAQYS